MNNNFINDNRLYMVFTDNNNKKHKAYHVVNGELVKTPEYETHLAEYAKHNYTSKDYNAGKKPPKKSDGTKVVAFLLIAALAIPTIFIGSFVKATMEPSRKYSGIKCGCGYILHPHNANSINNHNH